jgi:hypothetical protein
MLVVALHVPPAFSQSARVVYCDIVSLLEPDDVPDDVPVLPPEDGLAEGDVALSPAEPVDGAVAPPELGLAEVPPVLVEVSDEPEVPDVPELPAAPPAPLEPLLEPAAPDAPPALPLPPEAPPACATESAGARPMTATRNAKMTFFMGPPWEST